MGAEEKARQFGYARVSTREQNLDRQLMALREFGIEPQYVYCDKASGKDFQRPAYLKMLRRINEGDTLVVKSIDRLGRNYEEIIEQWRELTKRRGVHVVVLDMPLLDTRSTIDGITGTFLSDMVLQLLSYIAQIERENIHARQAEGIEAAKAKGKRFGRPPIERPLEYARTRERFCSGQVTRAQAANILGVSKSTFDRWVKADKATTVF